MKQRTVTKSKHLMYNSIQIQEEDGDDIELVFNPVLNTDIQDPTGNFSNGTPESPSTHVAHWSSCYINLTSTCIGAGIIGIPYAFSKSGWILGTFLILISGCFSFFGAHLLSVCATKSK